MKTAAKNILLLLILHSYSLTSAIQEFEDDESHSAMTKDSMGSNELNIEGPSDALRTKKICAYLFDLKM